MLTPLPGTIDFQRWEKEAGSGGAEGGWGAGDALLADSGGAAAEDVYAASIDAAGGDAGAHAEGLGFVLQHGSDLEAGLR